MKLLKFLAPLIAVDAVARDEIPSNGQIDNNQCDVCVGKSVEECEANKTLKTCLANEEVCQLTERKRGGKTVRVKVASNIVPVPTTCSGTKIAAILIIKIKTVFLSAGNVLTEATITPFTSLQKLRTGA